MLPRARADTEKQLASNFVYGRVGTGVMMFTVETLLLAILILIGNKKGNPKVPLGLEVHPRFTSGGRGDPGRSG